MLDRFSEGWIEFEGDEASIRKGKVFLHDALSRLVNRGA
jgi:hypothetical protein